MHQTGKADEKDNQKCSPQVWKKLIETILAKKRKRHQRTGSGQLGKGKNISWKNRKQKQIPAAESQMANVAGNPGETNASDGRIVQVVA